MLFFFGGAKASDVSRPFALNCFGGVKRIHNLNSFKSAKMPKFNFDLECHYNAEQKIWRGGKFKHYYDKNLSIGRLLYEELRRHPHKICQISDAENTILTNEQALDLSINVAKYFRSKGITQHDIIGLVGRNTTYLMVVALACFFNGTAFHAVNPYRDEKTIQILFNITKPKLLFFDGQDYEKIQNATKEFETCLITLKNHLAGVPTILDLLKPTASEDKFEIAELELGAEQTLAILCSSGTTGLPKAVTISNNKRIFDFSNFLTDEDVLFVGSTLDWYSGLLHLVSSIVYGATRIVSDKPYTPEYFIELVEKYKVTFVIQAPPQIALLLNCPTLTAEKLQTLRYFAYGGSKCPTSTQQRLQKYLPNAHLIFAYGFTEFGRIATANFNFAKKPNSAGRVLPGYCLKIIDSAGSPLGPGAMGEICCHHGEGWKGYYANALESAAIYDADGWFHSGDLGYFDEDQYLYVLERKKDLLKYQGMQYCPCEVEEVIAQLPDVLELCVFGVWNEIEGDAAAAVVVKEQNSQLQAEDVVNYVREHIEVKYKQLNAGAIILTELPKLPNGKINREAVKEIYLRSKSL